LPHGQKDYFHKVGASKKPTNKRENSLLLAKELQNPFKRKA
jgi:hypothetical protein